jgi:hypothetical protein
MTTQSSTIVQRVWNYCNFLRELAPMLLRGDGISCGDYVEQRLRYEVPGGGSELKSAFDGSVIG